MSLIGKCIKPAINNVPSIFTDTSGLTIQYDNLGVARVSFLVIHKADTIAGGNVSFTINGRNFVGTIDGIVVSELQGTSYKESRVTFVGFGC